MDEVGWVKGSRWNFGPEKRERVAHLLSIRQVRVIRVRVVDKRPVKFATAGDTTLQWIFLYRGQGGVLRLFETSGGESSALLLAIRSTIYGLHCYLLRTPAI